MMCNFCSVRNGKYKYQLNDGLCLNICDHCYDVLKENELINLEVSELYQTVHQFKKTKRK